MLKKTIYTMIAVCLVHFASAQEVEKIVTKDYVDNLIKTLSDDNMQGRKPFTPGIEKAATFIEAQFKEIGLKPLKGLSGYRQIFNKYQAKPLSANVTLNGKTIDPANILINNALFEKIKFSEKNSPEVIRLDPSKPFNSQLRFLKNNGKNQLILVDPKFADDFKAAKARSLMRGSLLDLSDIKKPSAMVFVLDNDSVATSYKVEATNTLTKMGDLFNVAGMIPGKSKKKEFVVFSGHYDHLGIGKPIGQDSIYNGADDDASGTTAMISLAKYYKALDNNERTLIFVAFTSEESGGYGSRYFSKQLDPDKVVAMFNIEMIGKDSKFGKNTAYITGYERSDFGKILQKNLEGTEFTFYPDPYPKENLFYRSDNATLAALGVPAHTISTVQIDGDKLYHSVKDEYSSLDTENIYATIKGIAKSAVGIVKGIDTPSRIPKL